MLQIGKDSYVTLAEAEEFAQKYIIETEKWNDLTDEVKEKYLRKSAQNIDKYIFIGKKTNSTQTMQFPRDIDGIFFNFIPEEIKNAQIIEAFSLINGKNKRLELQKEGVESFRIGDLSETFKETNIKHISSEAEEMIEKYIDGNVAEC